MNNDTIGQPEVVGGLVRWPNATPTTDEGHPTGASFDEREAQRQNLVPSNTPQAQTLDDYYSDAAVEARVKKLQTRQQN